MKNRKSSIYHGFIRTASLFALVVSLFTALSAAEAADAKKSVTVGAKAFPENQIVAKIFQFALEDAGFTVNFIPDLENAVLQTAIESGKIDLCPEYTNTGITSVLKLKPIFDTDEAYRVVKKQYEDKFGITWLKPSNINNTYTFVLSAKAAEANGIKTISDLQAKAGSIRAAKQNSWRERPDHLPGLEAVYGPFKFKDETIYDNGIKYQVLLNDQGDLTLGYTTDPQLEGGKLVAIQDDKHVWPPYYLVPIIRQDTLKKYPEIEEIINSTTAKLDGKTIIKLNADVILRHEEYPDVAAKYYKEAVKGK
jgi:osmoprotectant transport system substrate-binding protein